MQHLNSRLMTFFFQKQFAHPIMMYHTGKALLEINLKLSEISWFWDSSQALYAVALVNDAAKCLITGWGTEQLDL